MRVETITRTLYQYDELPNGVKHRACEWFRELEAQDMDLSFVIDDAVRIGEMLGLSFKTHDVKLRNGSVRQEPNIWYSVDCQDQGASFDATYSYRKGSLKAIKSHAPKDEALHSIARELAQAQRAHSYKLEASISAGRYLRMEFDDSTENAIVAPLLRFKNWIYCQIQEEYDYRLSDEQVEESIRANEYEFTEKGERA
jgi:hypothetical protein